MKYRIFSFLSNHSTPINREGDWFLFYEISLISKLLFGLTKVNKTPVIPLLILFFSGIFSIKAQQPTFRNIGVEDGLPSSTIYDILQDKQGYIWLGTELGLFQYDGIKFTEYPHPQNKKRSLSNLYLDKRGQTWMIDFYGQLYCLEQGKLGQFYTQNAGLEAIHISNYLIDSTTIWFPYEKGLIAYNTKDTKLKSYFFPDSSPYRVVDLIHRKNGAIYVLTDEGIIWKVGKETLQRVAQINHLNEEEEYRFFETQAGNLFLFDFYTTTSQFIFKYLENGKFQSIPIAYNTRITGMYEDTFQNLWVTTFRGIWGYNDALEPLDLPMPILQDRIVSSLVQDFEGSYWVGTLHSGLFFIPTMDMLLHNQSTSNFPDNRLSSLTKGNKNILYAGFNNGKIIKVDNRKIIQSYQTPTKLEINALLYDEQSKILWACSDYLYGFKDQTTQPFIRGIGGSTKDLVKVNNTGFVIGTSNYSFYFSHLAKGNHTVWEKTYKSVKNNSLKKLIPIRKKRCRAVLNNRFTTNKVWVAYSDGLYYLSPQMEEILNLEDKPIIAVSLAQTTDSILWVGTNGDGLYAIKEHQVIGHYNVSNGLASNFIKKIAVENNTLWLVSEKGIQQFNPAQKIIQQINQYDGLNSNEITDIEIIDNTAWIATPKGLNEYKLNQSIIDTIAPKLQISHFSIWEKDTIVLDKYELPHHQNNLKITLNGFSYRSGKDLNYQYRLRGLEKEWITTSFTNNTIRYPSLPPGNYQFEAKVTNAKGLTSKNNPALSIQINRPFWETTIFSGSVLCLLVALVYGILSTIIKNIRKKEQTEKALRGSQLAAIKAQMNPHFLFNAINSIQDFILINDKRQANTYLGKFANLMRIILEMSNQDLVKFSDEIHALQLYLDLETLRFEDTLTYELNVPNIPQESIYIPPMLIQPHVENAIKHGLFHLTSARKLWINCTLEPSIKQLKCIIEDNGIGREKAIAFQTNHSGFGQKSTLSRLELLNVGNKRKIAQEIIDLFDENGHPNGTRVILYIPYSH